MTETPQPHLDAPEEVETDDDPHAPPAGPGPFQGRFLAVRPLPRPAPLLTLPRAHTVPLLEQLGEANQRARSASLDRLVDWFPGYDFEAAAQTTDDRRFTVLVLGDSLGRHLDAIGTIDRIVGQHELRQGRLRFSHGDPDRRGQRPPRATRGPGSQPQAVERIDCGPAVAALQDHWTLILNGVDDLDPVLSGVTEDLERVYGCRVNTNVYVSFGPAEGFGPHWDMHDTIIVPASGTKRWQVFEPSVLSPLRPWIGPEVSQRPVWEGDLTPGMALVIPRGWGHAVQGSPDLASHYTIGVNRFTANQLVQRLEHEVGQWPIMRADLPYDPRRPVISYESSIHDRPEALGELLRDLAAPDLIDRALATYRARMPLRLFAPLSHAWRAVGTGDWSGLRIRLPVAAGVMAAGEDPTSVTVAFGDRMVHIARPAFEAFLTLADTAAHDPSAFPLIEGDDTGGRGFAEELVLAGLATVEPDDA